MKVEINAVVLTINDAVAQDEKQDSAGLAAIEQLQEAQIRIIDREVIRSDRTTIAEKIITYSDRDSVNLILTLGGTGLRRADLTPEATKDVIEREVPGIPDLMRMANVDSTPLAILSRAVAGIRCNTLIVNLPGSVKGVKESFAAIRHVLPHAIGALTDQAHKCGGRS
jgi:molybdopterin adenylyltransferase